MAAIEEKSFFSRGGQLARPRLLTFKTSPNSGASTWESVVVTFSTSTNASARVAASDRLTMSSPRLWKADGKVGW